MAATDRGFVHSDGHFYERGTGLPYSCRDLFAQAGRASEPSLSRKTIVSCAWRCTLRSRRRHIPCRRQRLIWPGTLCPLRWRKGTVRSVRSTCRPDLLPRRSGFRFVRPYGLRLFQCGDGPPTTFAARYQTVLLVAVPDSGVLDVFSSFPCSRIYLNTYPASGDWRLPAPRCRDAVSHNRQSERHIDRFDRCGHIRSNSPDHQAGGHRRADHHQRRIRPLRFYEHSGTCLPAACIRDRVCDGKPECHNPCGYAIGSEP